jgi:cytochrome c-type biogenesis protein
VYDSAPWISVVIGVALTALGIAMVAGYEPRLRWLPIPTGSSRQRARTLRAMFVFGVSYAIASIGCTLPTFLIVVAGTIENESFADGVIVFFLYAAGMALVLTALTVSMALARTSVLRLLRSAQPYIHSVSAVLVTAAGLYVTYYGVEAVRDHRSKGVPSSSLIDRVTDWSYSVSNWIESVGSLQIGVVVAAVLGLGLMWTARARRSSS